MVEKWASAVKKWAAALEQQKKYTRDGAVKIKNLENRLKSTETLLQNAKNEIQKMINKAGHDENKEGCITAITFILFFASVFIEKSCSNYLPNYMCTFSDLEFSIHLYIFYIYMTYKFVFLWYSNCVSALCTVHDWLRPLKIFYKK